MPEHAHEPLPRESFFLAKRATDVRQHDKLVWAPALPETAAPDFPPGALSAECEVHDTRDLTMEALVELQPSRDAEEPSAGRPGAGRRPRL